MFGIVMRRFYNPIIPRLCNIRTSINEPRCCLSQIAQRGVYLSSSVHGLTPGETPLLKKLKSNLVFTAPYYNEIYGIGTSKKPYYELPNNPLQNEHIAADIAISEHEKENEQFTTDIINKVNNTITSGEIGRLFAIVYVQSKQYKITAEDIVMIEGYWAPDVGDKIRLEKVMSVGCSDFTVMGRPLLNKDFVNITATVIEKTLSHPQITFKKRRRKRYRRIDFDRMILTTLRINTIEISHKVDELPAITGVAGRVF